MKNDKYYLNLFYAIVRQAAYDYNEKRDEEIKEFFYSEWFYALCPFNGEYIYRKIKENYVNTGCGALKVTWSIPRNHLYKCSQKKHTL